MIEITRWTRHDRPCGRRSLLTFDKLAVMLTSPVDARSKADLPGWAPVTFRSDYRSLRHIEQVSGGGVDVDGGTTLAELVAAWADHVVIIHSTASSTPEAPRFRVFVPWDEPITDATDARRVIRWMQRRTPGEIDTKTIDPSRLWYLPWSGSPYFAHATTDGAMLDARAVANGVRADEARAARPRFAPRPPTSSGYAHRALERATNAVASTGAGARSNQLAREAWSIGQLVGAGLLTEGEVLGAFARAVEGWPNERKTHSTIERQVREGAKHPRDVRRSPWS